MIDLEKLIKNHTKSQTHHSELEYRISVSNCSFLLQHLMYVATITSIHSAVNQTNTSHSLSYKFSVIKYCKHLLLDFYHIRKCSIYLESISYSQYAHNLTWGHFLFNHFITKKSFFLHIQHINQPQYRD